MRGVGSHSPCNVVASCQRGVRKVGRQAERRDEEFDPGIGEEETAIKKWLRRDKINIYEVESEQVLHMMLMGWQQVAGR